MAEREILYLALTRPALVLGVPIEGLVINVVACFITGAELQAPTIWRSPMMFWAAAIPIHYVLRFLTGRNYHWAREFRLWAMTVLRPTLYSLPIKPPRSGKEIGSSV